MLAAALGACRRDPWAGSPAAPGSPERTERWSIAVHGRIVGTEDRAIGPGWASTRTTYAWREGPSRSASLTICGDTCAVTTWDGEATEVREDGCAPELWPPAASATCRLGGVDTELVRDGDRVRYQGPLGPVEIAVDPEGRPERISAGGVVEERADGALPDPEPVDVADLLSIPTRPFPEARRSHVAVFEIDGERVRVDAPTRAELPPGADRIDALVAEVADRIAVAPVPGRRSGPRALALGRGDCTELALALVERAREEGLEARTAAGRVYVDEPRPALALHAWAEIRLGDRWFAADAAMRQFPADATHLRLGAWIADLAAFDGRSVDLVEVR